MAVDIDMKNLTGDDFGPVAADQQIVDTNSYQQEAQEYPVPAEVVKTEVNTPVGEPSINPQAEHFRALREEVDRMKAERESERKEYQLQLDLLRSNVEQQRAPNHPVQEAKMFADMRDDDIPTVAELRREMHQREASYQSRIEELQVQQQHSDYAEVINRYSVPLAKSDPTFVDALNRAENKALFAYQQGKREQRLQEAEGKLRELQAPKVSETAQRIVENSRKPGTLSQAGGQGALSKADYYATMSDQEFMKFAGRNLEGI